MRYRQRGASRPTFAGVIVEAGAYRVLAIVPFGIFQSPAAGAGAITSAPRATTGTTWRRIVTRAPITARS
jgi:hypothetical protein